MNADWSPEMTACWARLAAYDFDDPDHQLSFTDRLSRENAWPTEYAARVIEEYKRFCWLAVHANHPVTPSDAVDQVWHLHLTYSRDYWDRFCPDVLGQPLHHGPTKGGIDEDEKYRLWYEKTLHSYDSAFGRPPIDIWLAPDDRFADASQFVRVNRAALNTQPHSLLSLEAILMMVLGGGILMFLLLSVTIPKSVGFFSVISAVLLLLLLAIAFGFIRLSGRRNNHAQGNGCGGCGGPVGGDGGCGASGGCGGGGCGGGG